MKLTLSFYVSAFLSAVVALPLCLSACGGGGGGTAGAGGAAGSSAGGDGGSGGSAGKGGTGGNGGLFETGGGIPVGSGGGDTTSSGMTTSMSANPGDPCKSPNATTASALWSKKAGAANVQAALGVATDAQDNVAVVGNFLGSIDLGTGALNSAGQNDAYIAKLKSDGAAVWAKSFGDAQYHQHAQHAAFDAQGNMIVTGHFRGTLNFGGGALNNASNFFEDIFAVKLDSNGGHVWSKRYGDINTEEAQDVTTDAQGNVLFVGAFQSSLDFGGGKIIAEDGGFNGFVAKLSTAGAQVWAKSFGDMAAEQKTLGVATDKDGNVYIVGYHKGSIDFGGGALAADGTNQNAYVAKLTSAGAFIWAHTYGMKEASAVDVAVDAAGNAYIAGNFRDKINLGGEDFNAGAANNVFALKLDKDGKHVWSKAFGTANVAGEITSIALDGEEPVLLGTFTQAIDFGGGALTSAGGYDIFLAKLDTDGCQIHASAFGDPMLQRAETVAVDSKGSIVLGGSFNGTVDFGTGALTAAETDAYIVKMKP